MLWDIIVIVFSVTAVSTATTVNTSEQCPRNMFGRECVYRCQCANNSLCNPDSGDCGGGECHPGYTGPTCQYENSAFLAHVDPFSVRLGGPSSLGKIVDGNVEECIVQSENTSQTLTINLTNVLWADAIRVLLYEGFLQQSDIAQEQEIRIMYTTVQGNNITIEKPQVDKYYVISSRLPQPTVVSQVHVWSITGKSLAICEIIVQSGRLLTFRNTADSAMNANSSMCRKEQSFSSYSVHVGKAQVWQIKLPSTNGTQGLSKDAMAAIRVNVTLSDETTEKEVSVTPAGSGFLRLMQPENASKVTLWTTSPEPRLCGAVVQGICQPGWFGQQCENKCDCAQTCNELTGVCEPTGAVTSFTTGCTTGDNCNLDMTSGSTTLQPVLLYSVTATLALYYAIVKMILHVSLSTPLREGNFNLAGA